MMNRFALAAVAMFAVAPASAAVTETWEGLSQADPFSGTGNVTWTGDAGDWEITTATWPFDTPDFNDDRSLRTRSGFNSSDTGTPTTVLTDVSSEFSATGDTTWNILLGGSEDDITPSKRMDFILLSNTSTPALIADPNATMEGYKLTIWDPVNSGTTGHGAATLGDSISLWSTKSGEDDWSLVATAFKEFDSNTTPTDLNINEFYDIDITRSIAGEWDITVDLLRSSTNVNFSVTDHSVDLSGSTWYSGVSVLSTSGASNDFGFDDFSLSTTVIPEPATGALALLGIVMLLRRRLV